MTIHYFLTQERDWFLRIGTEGDKEVMEDYLRNGKKADGSPLYTSVEYIGEFADVIYTDVDTEVGIGNRRIPGGHIRTCKYIYQLRSKAQDGDYFQYLREYHEMLKVSVMEQWKEKQRRAGVLQ